MRRPHIRISLDAVANFKNAWGRKDRERNEQGVGDYLLPAGTRTTAGLEAAAPDIAAAAVLVFVNRLDAYTRRISGEGMREAWKLAVREFGVDPEWVYGDHEDGTPAYEAEVLRWEAEDPTYGSIPDLADYDTRPERYFQ